MHVERGTIKKMHMMWVDWMYLGENTITDHDTVAL